MIRMFVSGWPGGRPKSSKWIENGLVGHPRLSPPLGKEQEKTEATKMFWIEIRGTKKWGPLVTARPSF